MNSSWKEIRIISKKDKLPDPSKILDMVNFSKELINQGRSYIIFDIDNLTVKSQNRTSHYDFGELRRVRND